MLRKIFHILILFFTIYNFVSAQFHSFYGAFQPVTDMVCPFDDTKIIKSTKDYYFYYTKDNLPFGEIDSAFSCINLTSNFSSVVKISGNQLLPKRPLFIRDYGVRKNRENLLSNQLYSFYYMSVHASDTAFSSTEPQSYGINYWEHAGESTSDTAAFQTSTFLDQGSSRYLSAEYCHITSKSERQEFLGTLYAIYFDSALTVIPDITLYSYGGISVDYNPVDNDEYIIAHNATEGEIFISAIELFGSTGADVHLILHTKDGYPSPENISNKTIRLVPNPSEQKDIRVMIYYGGIHFQEFTGLMTEYLQGQDSIRHNLYLELLEDNLCLGLIEFVFNPPLSFRYGGGNIEFTDNASCMLVNKGSEFRINKKADVKYGEGGKGMLALDGGKIYIEDDAGFMFDGILVIKNRPDHHLYIGKNAKLEFTEKAEIWAHEGHYLYVHAFPWQVNLQKLDLESRKKLIIVEPDNNFFSSLVVYPSLLSNDENIFIGPVDENEVIYILNSQGLLVSKHYYNKEAGLNAGTLPSGLYFVSTGQRTSRFLKMY